MSNVDSVLNRVTKWHHLAVGVVVFVVPALVLLGFMGRGAHPERFDAKQIVVTPSGHGVRIREVVDQDFGAFDRHGYQRIIPNDFGRPINVTASSPDAPHDVSTEPLADFTTRIRIGDPQRLITGQHRYVLTYTLPDARLGDVPFALDVIGTETALETGNLDVILDGFELDAPSCDRGTAGTVGGCTFVRSGTLLTAHIGRLRAHEGVTVRGIVRGTTSVVDVPVPPVPPRRSPARPVPLAVGGAALGAMAAVGTYLVRRRGGRNQVSGTASADAAFGTAQGPVRLVSDHDLEEMATTEFEPPPGLRPWQGALLLRERVDDHTISAWVSDQIAQGVVELEDGGKRLVPGPQLAVAPPSTKERFEELFDGAPSLELGKYQPRLNTMWLEITDEQGDFARQSGWWVRGRPGSVLAYMPSYIALVVAVGLGILAMKFPLVRHSVLFAVVAALVLPLAAAAMIYAAYIPSRSATGSAVALRTESFRRFLNASEGQHVDWAWQHGLLREYSAWAVALDAADAWGKAVAASAVPRTDVSMATTPLLMHTAASSWHASYSRQGGGSGGGVGGGGGGGGSGSW